ncbi:MAG: ABC transporter permease [Candidatus Bathyarchaeia archaeon]
MADITALIIKEVKELVRDPKILIGVVVMPLILFPIMGTAVQISQESVQRSIIEASFSVYVKDEGLITDQFLDYLYENNTVIPIHANDLQEALNLFQETDSNSLIYIPEGYSDNISRGVKAELWIYANLKSLNMAETQSTTLVSNLVSIYHYYFSINRIERLISTSGKSWDPVAVRNPISIEYSSILKGNVLGVPPSAIMNLVLSQSVMLPVMIMMMIIFAIQMAATSIALEKEQKTLETLMTLPVGRLTILTGKLSGSIIIAIAGAISYMIGFSFYMQSAFSFVPESTTMNLSDIQVGLTPLGFVLIGINIFMTLVSALAMALSLATFTDNVRGAQSLTGFLTIPVIIPAIILMFTDIEMLPTMVQWVLLIIPYTHSIIASKAAFLGNYLVVLRSIAFITIFTVAILYIAARIFSTERIITAKLTTLSLKKLFQRD